MTACALRVYCMQLGRGLLYLQCLAWSVPPTRDRMTVGHLFQEHKSLLCSAQSNDPTDDCTLMGRERITTVSGHFPLEWMLPCGVLGRSIHVWYLS